MGFIDPSGSLGRHFGGIGVALNEIAIRLSMSRSNQLIVSGPSASRAKKCTQVLCHTLKVSKKLKINIESAIPEHAGLGSGTQMSLAIGSALNAFYDLNLSIHEISRLTERGMRSGIGIGVFAQGGLVIDGGKGDKTIIPPIIVHMDIPNNWRFILILDKRGKGLHGKQEINAFKKLPHFPSQKAARLCYLLLMQGLPAIAEHDIVKFGEVIEQLQQSIGAYFTLAQGGVFTSLEVNNVLQWLQQQGAVAIGQSSWGPTGFCATDTWQKAKTLKLQLHEKFAHFKNLSFVVVSACNAGGSVCVG